MRPDHKSGRSTRRSLWTVGFEMMGERTGELGFPKKNWQIRIRVYYRVSAQSPDCSGRGSGTGQGGPSAAFPAWLDAEKEGFTGECLLGHAHTET